MDLFIIRGIFVFLVGLACYLLQPFGEPRLVDTALGLVLGCSVILFEIRLRTISLKRLIGAALGSVLGILGAYLFSVVIRNAIPV